MKPAEEVALATGVPGVASCSDGGCIFGHPPGGMHTNGGCRCLGDGSPLGPDKRVRLRNNILALRAAITAARAEGEANLRASILAQVNARIRDHKAALGAEPFDPEAVIALREARAIRDAIAGEMP